MVGNLGAPLKIPVPTCKSVGGSLIYRRDHWDLACDMLQKATIEMQNACIYIIKIILPPFQL